MMFIDFGNSEELPSTYLRPLPPRFAETPLFAFCVIPQGVCPADPRLVALLEQEPFSAVQVDVAHGGLPVVRLERRDGTCLNTLAAGGQPKVGLLWLAFTRHGKDWLGLAVLLALWQRAFVLPLKEGSQWHAQSSVIAGEWES